MSNVSPMRRKSRTGTSDGVKEGFVSFLDDEYGILPGPELPVPDGEYTAVVSTADYVHGCSTCAGPLIHWEFLIVGPTQIGRTIVKMTSLEDPEGQFEAKWDLSGCGFQTSSLSDVQSAVEELRGRRVSVEIWSRDEIRRVRIYRGGGAALGREEWV